MLFSDIHMQILYTMKSNTMAEMSDEQLSGYLNAMLIRAIGDFRFPQVPLTYTKVEATLGEPVDYQFTNEITQREINVLLALVKKNWIEHQLDNESLFQETYYDGDVKVFSKGNLINVLNQRLDAAKKEMKTVQYNYSRVRPDGSPSVGAIHE